VFDNVEELVDFSLGQDGVGNRVMDRFRDGLGLGLLLFWDEELKVGGIGLSAETVEVDAVGRLWVVL
jgi:hypothetical protein